MIRSLLLLVPMSTAVFANTIHYHQEISPLGFALRTGADTDGKALYLCTANLFNSIQPGKTWAGYGYCNIPYGGKEYVIQEFNIPDQRTLGRVVWDRMPHHPLNVGRDTNGNTLFLCRANFNGSIQPGKTWPGYNHCNISYRGREIIMNDYSILNADKEIIIRGRPPLNAHGHR